MTRAARIGSRTLSWYVSVVSMHIAIASVTGCVLPANVPASDATLDVAGIELAEGDPLASGILSHTLATTQTRSLPVDSLDSERVIHLSLTIDRLLIVTLDGVIRLFSLPDANLLQTQSAFAVAAAYSPGGNRVAIVRAPTGVHSDGWDLQVCDGDLKVLTRIPLPLIVRDDIASKSAALSWSPDETTIAVSYDARYRLAGEEFACAFVTLDSGNVDVQQLDSVYFVGSSLICATLPPNPDCGDVALLRYANAQLAAPSPVSGACFVVASDPIRGIYITLEDVTNLSGSPLISYPLRVRDIAGRSSDLLGTLPLFSGRGRFAIQSAYSLVPEGA